VDAHPRDVNAIAREQHARLPGLVSQIEALLQTADPIEVLSHLTVLYQTHGVSTNDRNEKARWQARIEWLAWLVFSHHLSAPARPVVIDATFLDALEQRLDEYFTAAALSLIARDPALTEHENELRSTIQNEALFVRVLGYRKQIEQAAVELYSPHDAWSEENIGLRIQDAFEIATTVSKCASANISNARERARAMEERLENDMSALADYANGLPIVIREAIANGTLDTGRGAAKSFSILWLFFSAPTIISFTVGELLESCGARIPVERIRSFFDLLTIGADDVNREPSAMELPPFAVTPFVAIGERYYIFVPPRLYEAIFYAFHTKLFVDNRYRGQYDKSRGEWLEASAIAAIRGLFGTADSAWGLVYGPKKERLELDGIAVYDNKVILLECKSKSPTLAALAGDVPAILNDLQKAILDPFDQAKRARDYILEDPSVEFEEKRTGQRIIIQHKDVSEIYLVALVGSGAWASIAANLPSLTPFGLFADGQFPWALSLSDLRTVLESMELPSQLFDYLHRRYALQKDGRFFLHDEWDFLGAYFAGVLDPASPSFSGADGVTKIALDGFDDDLQDYYFALSAGAGPVPPRPRRDVPKVLLALLREVDRSSTRRRSDAIRTILGWPDAGLKAIEANLAKTRTKALWDGKHTRQQSRPKTDHWESRLPTRRKTGRLSEWH
jgi:hypothetical protein